MNDALVHLLRTLSWLRDADVRAYTLSELIRTWYEFPESEEYTRPGTRVYVNGVWSEGDSFMAESIRIFNDTFADTLKSLDLSEMHKSLFDEYSRAVYDE